MSRLLKSIRLTNFLSYGPNAPTVELLPLNVIIGPNGSGKSNLFEAIDVLRATPTDVTQPIRDGGGVEDFLWKGLPTKGRPAANIQTIVYYPEGKGPLKYRLAFTMVGQRFEEFRRLEADKLQEWLQQYKLGELWKMGELGGTRW